MTRDQALDKIMKLYAHAESAKRIGSLAEAQAFAEKVQQMLVEYHVSMSDVEFARRIDTDPIAKQVIDWKFHGLPETRRRVLWTEALAQFVARTHGCETMCLPRSNVLVLVGREAERRVAEYLIVTLTAVAQQLCQRALVIERKFYGRTVGWRFRDSFFIGFVMGIQERLAMKNQSVGKHYALARIDTLTQAAVAFAKAAASGKSRRMSLPQLNMKAAAAGRFAASGVSLEVNALDAPVKRRCLKEG